MDLFLTLRRGAVILALFQNLLTAQTSLARLVPIGLLNEIPAQPGSLEQEPAVGIGLHILVIDGEDGINIIKKKTAVKPVVEVRDRNNLPVAGVVVTFSSPGDGASVVFSNGARSMTAITDANGRAMALGSRPLNVGHFQIGVSASYQSETATLSIPMTNVMTATAATAAAGTAAGTTGGTAAAGISGVTIGIIAGVAAAAAVGLAVGLSHHGAVTTATTPSAAVGAAGGATAGPP